MVLLVVNIGTTSLKCAVFSIQKEVADCLGRIKIYPLDVNAKAIITLPGSPTTSSSIPVSDAKTALEYAVSVLVTHLSMEQKKIEAVSVRIVHGGDRFYEPTVITDDVISELQETVDLAPLHNPVALQALRHLRTLFSNLPIIGVFDTMFHQTMPERAKLYAISPHLASQYHIKRYGFHGLAHESMLLAYAKEVGMKVEDVTILTIQLGSGSSICAIKQGKSVDCSMGFSPLEGLLSRTRCGDIDASVVSYLSHIRGMDPGSIINALNKESGLKGITGGSGSFDEILVQAKSGDGACQLALDMYLYRLTKYIGAFDAAIGGATAFVFGGGVTESCPEILHSIFENTFFQVSVPFLSKDNLHGRFCRVSQVNSKRHAWVSFIDEEERIALHAFDKLT